MRFVIITHVIHGQEQGDYFGYEPYVREMNLWLKAVAEVSIVAPLQSIKKEPIHDFYKHKTIRFVVVPSFSFTSIASSFKAIAALPKTAFAIYKAMKKADHIHLRCPGNMGMLGCVIQIFFPNKRKTAKYAGNWDLNAKQPLSYRFQKWILRNTFLTKNMQVLVYGEWENSTKNIKPFFTASYFEKDKTTVKPKTLTGKLSFVFVGTLSNGKQPLYAIYLIEKLHQQGYDVQLNIYGEGAERKELETYITKNSLENLVFLRGNQSQETLKQAYTENHFVVLPSLSEGWPKVVAEGMFWGCLPIASSVSCVPNMLDNGKRGLLLTLNLQEDVTQIRALLQDSSLYQEKVNQAVQWSQQYTMDVFESEIKKLLQP